jgi:deazaflavin-dependent oxidoreductase (nitroreductase family)
VNERILRDGCEAVAFSGNLAGPVSSPTIDHWMAFVDDPTARAWYRAHNGSVVAGYLEHRDLAEAENAAERFFMNVVLCRVLFTHALVAAPRLSLGWLRPLAPLLGDPRLGMTGIFLSLSRVLPAEYPLRDGVSTYLERELGFGRLVDYGVIVPRLQQLYEWSAQELGAPALLDYVRDGALTYAWSYEERDVWRAPDSVLVRVVHQMLPPTREETAMADDSAAQKRRRIRWVQRYLVNPPAKVAVWCGVVPGFVLVETTGRRSGKRRRNVVGMKADGEVGWVVAEHGRHAGYVNNLEANPDVRVRMHRRWRAARAQIMDDDDPQARLDSFGRRSHEAAVRRFGTDLLTIKFQFQPE